MKKIITIIAGAFAICTSLFAQTDAKTTYFLDGYDFRHRLNPATPSARSYFTLPVLGYTSVGVSSNMGINTFLYPTGSGLTTFMSNSVDTGTFLKKLNKNNLISEDFTTSVISIGAWGKKNGFTTVELNLRESTSINLPKDLFSFMKNVGGAQHYNISNLGIKARAYAELSLGHSQRINEKLVVGAKVKALLGLASAELKMNNLNIEMSGEKWSVQAEGSLKASVGEFVSIPTYGETGNVPEGKDANQIDFSKIGMNTSNFSPTSVLGGFGVAFDLGFSYEVLKGLTVSAAVLDLGFIHWKSPVMAATGSKPWEFQGFQNVSLDNESENSINNQIKHITDGLQDLTVLYKQDSKAYNEMLSATINAAVEYKMPFWDGLSVGGLFTTRIQGTYSTYEGRVSVNLAVANFLGLSASYGLSNFGSTFGAFLNLHCRAVDFFVGTDSLVTNFGTYNNLKVPYKKLNLAMNFGLAFNVSKRKDNRGFIL